MHALKTFFIRLLIFFIPLQGMAANTLLVCKAANQGAQQSHAISSGDMHQHPCAGVDRAPALQDETRDKRQQSDVNCAAQYAGAPWLFASVMTVPLSGFSSDRISYAGFYMLSFIPEGPERPPRSFSL